MSKFDKQQARAAIRAFEEGQLSALAVAGHLPAALDRIDELEASEVVVRGKLHQARLGPWSKAELMSHLVAIVDALGAEKKPGDLDVSPLDVALELLGGELEAFVLFGRMGHLDPPRDDGNVPVAVLRCMSEDPAIDEVIRETAKKWVLDQESRS